MNNNNSSFGWIIAIIAFIALAIGVGFNATSKTSSKTTQPVYTAPKETTTTTVKTTKAEPARQEPQPITWSCVDATSYNKDPYDDNLCTSSTNEVRYVSDSQARALDPSYTPGTSGHPYYNSK